MSTVALLSLVALLIALLERWRRRHETLGVDGLVLAGSTFLAVTGILATLLATAGLFAPGTLAGSCAGAAMIVWPWKLPRVRWRTPKTRLVAYAALAVVAAMALRLPLSEYSLAGRDQGTYELRAQHTARTGELGFVDSVVARAGHDVGERSGPADILGLYTKRHERWRRGLYEAAYRPGLYLESRNDGVVVPQFLHLHPMLLATAHVTLGAGHAIDIIAFEALLALLAIWAVARRLFPEAIWAWVVAGLVALSPITIWVHRAALTETLSQLLFWATVLAALRGRDHPDERPWHVGILFGAAAWVRGNVWIVAPVVLGFLLLRSDRKRGPTLVFIALLVTSILLHATTVFPYLHDEITRQLQLREPVIPGTLVGATTAGALAWLALDIGRAYLPFAATSTRLNAIVAALPRVLASLAALATIVYISGRLDARPGAPFSRLDPARPLLGLPWLIAAAVGLIVAARKWRPERAESNVWLIALASSGVASMALYSQRNLPQVGLYYYGRYLVPLLVPGSALLCAVAARWLFGLLRSRGRWFAAVPSAVALSVIASGSSWVLVVHPESRLQEFAESGRAVQWLADRVPDDAIVIAGGEGWHHGHTFNQVGGALHLGRGRSVLPYRNAEAAYATLHELLIAGPAATGQTPPPTYLLINEATHALGREQGPVAAVDDTLPAPFVSRRIDLLELFVHRLTPSIDAPPSRVTRDDLRMALMRVEVDGVLAERVRTWTFAGKQGKGPGEIEVKGGHVSDGRLCLRKKQKLELTLGGQGSLDGPQLLVLVAAPGTARHNARWRIKADGRSLATGMPRERPRERDTLGPFVLTQAPTTLEIRGSKHKTLGASCPYGGLAELRLLPLTDPVLETAEAEAATIAPANDLGHPYELISWVSGRGLSRYRPGTNPDPEVAALSLVLYPDEPMQFAPAQLPAGGARPIDVVVTLTKMHVGPEARLIVSIDGKPLDEIDPPDDRRRSWQSTAQRFTPTAPVATVRLELVNAESEDAQLHVRDVGLFSTGPAIPSTLAQ